MPIMQQPALDISGNKIYTKTNPNNDLIKSIYDVGTAINAANNQNAMLQMQYQTASAEKAMKFNSEEAEKNRQFQKMMSDTSYQRAVADLKKAGLNPILAVNGGASTSAGTSAQGVAMSGAAGKTSDAASMLMALPTMVNAFTQVASSAFDALQNNKGAKKVNDIINTANNAVNTAEKIISPIWKNLSSTTLEKFISKLGK